MSHHEALKREAEDRLNRWLAAVEGIPRGDYTMVAGLEELPAQVRADSCYWCDHVFSPEANPHDAPDARHGYHLAGDGAPDLLRHEYSASGLALTVIEGRNFLLVRVARGSLDIPALPAEARAPALQRAAALLFRAPWRRCTPSFQPPEALAEGDTFSSDVGADPLLLSCWTERVDGGIRGGELYFVSYKKPAQRTGFAHAEAWFDESFRRRA